MIQGFSIIFLFLLTGEGVSRFSGIPVPGNVVGMVLMTAALLFGIVKKEWITECSEVLLKNMAFFFIPPGVGLMQYFDILKTDWAGISAAVTFGTLAVAATVGLIQQRFEKDD